MLFLLSTVTGVLMHRRLFRQLFTLRWRWANVRLAFSDTHKLAGVWGLPFHLVIGITGAWLGLYGLIGPGWSTLPPQPGTVRACESPIFLDCVLSETRRAIPGFSPVFVDFGKDGSTVAVRGNVSGQLFRRHEAGAVFEVATGQPIGLDAPGRISTARRVDLAAAPLHFGDFAGSGVKWLYAVFSLLGAALAVTGVLMWSRRGSAGEQSKRQVAARAFCALAGGNLVATLALPMLALLAVAGMGPGFAGSMRLSDLPTPEAAPVLLVFLVLWLLTTAGLAITSDPSKMAKAALGLAGLCIILAPVAAVVLRYGRELGGMDVLLHPTTLALLTLGLMALVAYGVVGFRPGSGTFSTELVSQRGRP